jgi:HK97 family phage major capsid protein
MVLGPLIHRKGISVENEVKSKLEELHKVVHEFKSENDRRWDEVKKKGHADPLLQEKVDKTSAAIDKFQDEVAQIKTAMNRTAMHGGADETETKSKKEAAEYKAAFDRFLRKGVELPESLKAMSVDNDPQGGFLVRPELSNMIVKKLFETSPIRQLASVQTISSDFMDIFVDYDEAAASWVSERGSRSNTNNPTWNMAKLPVHELYAEPAATQKMLDDAAIDIEAWLAAKVADKFARTEEAAFVTGSGVGQPKGFASYASGTGYGQIEQVGSGSSGAVVADKLIALQGALLEPYQANACFLMARATRTAVRQLKDSQNRYLWGLDGFPGGLDKGVSEQLLGKPLHLAADMAAMGAGSLSIAYGDFKAGYQIVDRMGIRVLRDAYTSKPNVLFYTTKRVGGDVVNFQAIKLQILS